MSDIKIKEPWGTIPLKYPWILVPLAFFLFFTRVGFNGPIIVMAVTGIYLLFRKNEYYQKRENLRYFIILSVAWIVPMLIALPDAVHHRDAVTAASVTLALLLSSLFFIFLSRNRTWIEYCFLAVCAVVVFWCLDAIVQFFVGYNFFGAPYKGGRLLGMFGPRQNLGPVVACLSPLVFEWTRLYWRRYRWTLCAPLLIFFTVMLSGNRSAWIMLLSAVSLYVMYLTLLFGVRYGLKLILSIVAGVSILAFSAYQTPVVKFYVDNSAALFKVSYEGVEKASSGRLVLWKQSVKLAAHNWKNGVGPRGFRHAYTMDEPQATPNRLINNANKYEYGQLSANQISLEILVETGVIGFVGYFVILVVLTRLLFRSINTGRLLAVPWLISALVVLNPANIHKMIYANYWSSVTWMIIFMAVATFVADRRRIGGQIVESGKSLLK